MSNWSLRSSILLGFALLITPVIVFGQNTDELCQAFVNRAFGDMGNNCANLGINEACYGFGNFGSLTSSFYVDGEAQVLREDVFTEPAARLALLDASEISTLESLTATDFVLGSSSENSVWGLATLELPVNLSEQSAVFVLFGGARLENGVLPAAAVQLPASPLSVSSNGEISVFGSPQGLGYSVPDDEVGTVEGALNADAISADGEWLRIQFSYERQFGERSTAWVKVADLATAEGIESLPVIAPDSYTPMQKLFLSNNLGEPECSQVPAAGLLVQGPSAIETDFVLGEMPVRLTSTAYFRQVSGGRLQVMALTGFTVLYPDSPNETVIPEGFSRTVCLSAAQDLGIDGQVNDFAVNSDCPSAETRPLTGADLLGLQLFEDVPSNLLNYAITVPYEICPSGIGNVQCILVPASPERIEAKCEEALLPEDVCAAYGF